MSETLENPEDEKVSQTETEDGRRRRSERSREQIIEAMFELVRKGQLDPGAAQIAEAANVSLRTVFRHFEEMDGLYQEMNRRVREEVMPIVESPLHGVTWQDKVRELVERRSDVFERIMPYRVCGSIRRFRSSFLLQGHNDFVALERAILDAALPDEVKRDATLEAAFDAAMGFDTWRRLRQDRAFSVEESKATIRRLIDALIAAV